MKSKKLNCKNPSSKSFKLNVEIRVRDKPLSEYICRKFFFNKGNGENR